MNYGPEEDAPTPTPGPKKRSLRTAVQALAGVIGVIAAVLPVLAAAGVTVSAELAAALVGLGTVLASTAQNMWIER